MASIKEKECEVEEATSPEQSTPRGSTSSTATIRSTGERTSASVSRRSQSSRPSRRAESTSPRELEALAAEDTSHALSWRGASLVMTAETISLGIMTLAQAYSKLGFAPACILTFVLGVITALTGYVNYSFTQRHGKDSLPKAAEVIFGRWGRIVAECHYHLFLLFLAAGHVLAFSIALSSWFVDKSQGCNVIWETALGAFICFVCTIPRFFNSTSWMSIVSCISISAATILTMVDVGILSHSKGTDPGKAFVSMASDAIPWWEVCMAISNILLSYTGQVAYPSIISEMREPKDFPKALAWTSIITTIMYTVPPAIIYYYAGAKVPSPALSAASPMVTAIAYGIAMPTIIVAGVIPALVACKAIYTAIPAVKALTAAPSIELEDHSGRSSRRRRGAGQAPGRLRGRFTLHVSTERRYWLGVIFAFWVLAYLVANSIPFFGPLLALIGALVGTWIALGFPGMMLLHMTRQDLREGERKHGWKTWTLQACGVALIVMSVAALGMGLIGSVMTISKLTSIGKPFSCTQKTA